MNKCMNKCMFNLDMCVPQLELPRVIIVGGGFAGIPLAKALKNKPVQLILLDKNNFHQFLPLLYQVATSGLEPDSIAFPLRKQFHDYENFIFRMAEIIRIIPEENKLETSIGAIAYDYLVLGTGSNTNFFGLKDVSLHANGMKTIQEALDLRSLILQNFEQAVSTCDLSERDALTNFMIVGGGPAGVETAGALAEFKKYILPKDYPELDPGLTKLYLLEAGKRLLSSMSEKASFNAYNELKRMGVQVRLQTGLQSYDGLQATTNTGESFNVRTLIWTAGVKGAVPKGIKESALARGNRILVDEYNRVKGYENIFAIGDVAAMISDKYPGGHPMVAQAAIQQGKQLGKNIMNLILKRKPLPFIYKDKGSLATIGKKRAVADLNKIKLSGFFAWLIWSLVHLITISGFRNKVMVTLDWTWSYLTYEKGNRLIIRKYNKKEK